MADLTLTNPIDTFLASLDQATARTNLGLGSADNVTHGSVTSSAYIVSSASIITDAGISRTLTAGDNGKTIVFTSASAITVTVPAGLGAAFSCGFIQAGAGAITFAASGTTLNAVGGFLTTSAQHSLAAVLATSANVFNVAIGGGTSGASAGFYDMSRDATFMAAYAAGTDCQTTLQNALTNCLSWGFSGVYLPYLSGKKIKFSGQLLVPVGVSVKKDRLTKLEYTGTADEAHVVVGTANVYNANVDIDIEVVRTTPAVWSAKPNDCGVLLHSPNFSRLKLGADFFTNGVIIKAGTEPASWLSIDLYLIRDAQYGLTFHKTANSVNCYINEITIRHADGEFNISSGCYALNGYTAGTKFPVGVRYRSDFDIAYFDNHSYEKPCFELNGGGSYPYVAPFQFEGSANTICAQNIRSESGLPLLIRHVSGTLHSIDMHLGYTDSTFKLGDMYESVAGQNYFSNVRIWGAPFPGSGGGNTWRSPNLGSIANQYDSAGRIYVPGFYWHSSSDNTRQKRSIGSSNTITADSIEIINTDCIGALIQLGDCRVFRVRPIVKSGGSFLRQAFIPWNEALTQRYAPAYLLANVTAGAITGFTILQGGKYDTVPTLTVAGGTGLVCTPVLDVNGAITSVTVTNGGTGYSNNAPANIVSNDPHWLIGAAFQEDEVGFYGCYSDGAANPQGYTLQVRNGVKYVEWRGRASGGSVQLSGFLVESLDGNPITVRSWFDGYSDPTKRFINFNPTGVAIKGSYSVGELLLNDARSASSDAYGYSYRGGTNWDSVAAGGVTDGDKGDIVVSSSGTVWTIDSTISPQLAGVKVGGVTASFPMLTNSGSSLVAKLADGSGTNTAFIGSQLWVSNGTQSAGLYVCPALSGYFGISAGAGAVPALGNSGVNLVVRRADDAGYTGVVTERVIVNGQVNLEADAANIAAIKNGSNTCGLRIYRGATNYADLVYTGGRYNWAYDAAFQLYTSADATLRGDTYITLRSNGNVLCSDGTNGIPIVASGFQVSANNVVSSAATAYTLSASDNGKTLYFTAATSVTVTINTGLAAGFACDIIQAGAGVVNVNNGTATKQSRGSLFSTNGQHARIRVQYVSTDTYNISGDRA